MTRCTHGIHQLLYLEGLDDIAPGTGKMALDAIQHTVSRRKNKDWRAVEAGVGFKQTQHIITVDFGQTDIEEDQVRQLFLVVFEGLYCLYAIFITCAGNAGAPHRGFHNSAYYRRIIDNHNLLHRSEER